MRALDKHFWAVNSVLLNWSARSLEKPRQGLPPAFTGRVLATVRQNACRAGGVSECLSWKGGVRIAPEKSNPCKACAAPRVSMHQVAVVLGSVDPAGEPSKEKSVWRRWMHRRHPMQLDDFCRALVHATAEGWLSAVHFRNSLFQAIELSSTCAALIKLKRSACGEHEFEDAFEDARQCHVRELLDSWTKRLNQNSRLDPDLRRQLAQTPVPTNPPHSDD